MAMRFPIVTVIALTIGAGVSLAQGAGDEGVNRLGVYFDGDWTQTCHEPVAAMQPFRLYFVLRDVEDFDAIVGIEFGWRLEPEPTSLFAIQVIEPPGNVCCIPGTLYNFLFCGYPIPVTGPAVILDITFISLTELTAVIQLGPPYPASLPGRGSLWTLEPLLIEPLEYPSAIGEDGWTITGVATIGDCPQATESTVWGAMKATFR